MSKFKITLTKEFLILNALIALIYVALELYYHNVISVIYEYMGFKADFNSGKYIITKIVFLLLLALSYTIYNRTKFLYSIYLLLLFFFYIPNAILFSFSNIPGGPFVSNVFFICVFLITPYIKFPLPNIGIPQQYKGITLIALSVILLIPIILTFKLNINLKTLFLSEIYETRENFSKYLDGYLAYLYNFEAKTIIPAALVFFMIRKKPLLIGLFILILLYLFVISGNKLVYFTPMIVVFFYYVGKDYMSQITYFLLITLCLFALFPFFDAYIGGPKPFFGGIFINRFFFIPALTTHFYFDFFNGHPFYFAETHFINHFIKSPYDMPVGFLITKVYWGAPTAFASNGIISDGFMNLGYYGVGLFSVIFALLFSFFNSLNLHKGFYGIFFSYIYIILSAPLLTCFITGGIFLFILMSFTILSDKKLIN